MTKLLNIKEFKLKIKKYIPHHELVDLPKIGDKEGHDFLCGCNEKHILNFDQHYLIAVGETSMAVFLSPVCGYLNCIQLNPRASAGVGLIRTLFSTKFLANKPKFGLDDQPDFIGSIKKYFK